MGPTAKPAGLIPTSSSKTQLVVAGGRQGTLVLGASLLMKKNNKWEKKEEEEEKKLPTFLGWPESYALIWVVGFTLPLMKHWSVLLFWPLGYSGPVILFGVF